MLTRQSWIATSKVNRGERVLERLVNSKKLTENGKAAFIAAVDPFHDACIDHLRGWPDLESQPSVIRAVKRSTSVTSTGLGHSIVIDTYPILDSINTNSTARNNNVLGVQSLSATTDIAIGGVSVTNYNTSTGNFSPATRSGGPIQLGPDEGIQSVVPGTSYLDAKTRLIGFGVEVHDVTAEINKQGTLTVCQIPQSQRLDQTLMKAQQTVGLITYSATAVTTRPISNHPLTVANAMLFEGSRQWEAKEGCYAVIPFSTEENPPRNTEYCQPMMYEAQQDDLYGANTTNVWLGQYIGQPANSNFVYYPHRWAPIHSKVIYLTGLNALSTFQINVIYYLETFPDFSTTELITLARPSACYDPVALKMISCAMQELPVGVPVSENGFGDWFLDVVETVAPVAGEFFGGLIGGPAGAVAGGAAGMTLSKVVRESRNQQVAPPSPNTLPPTRPSNRLVQKQKKKKNKKKQKLDNLIASDLAATGRRRRQ